MIGSTTFSHPVTVSPRLARARRAVFLAFLLNGFAIALWVVNIPTVARVTGVDNGALGTTLLALGAGSVVAMQVAGHLAARAGSRPVVAVGALLLALGLASIGLATNGPELAAALFVLGLGNGGIDVAMNDQAVRVERGYGRPIMSAFHAVFSVGGALGAVCGVVVQSLGSPFVTVLWAAAVLTAVAGVIAAVGLLPRSGPSIDAEPAGAAAAISTHWLRRAVLLGGLAFAFMLAEGMVNDWSAIHATQHLHQPASVASLAYLAFAVTMTAGRFLTDRVVMAIGPVRVVRVGSLAATAGLLVVVLSPVYAVTLAGWVLFGIGLAGIVPQLFTAAGGVAPGGSSAVVLSRIVSAGYLGMLAGPAAIGWLSNVVGIDLALVLPLLLVAAGIVLAPQVAPPLPPHPAAPSEREHTVVGRRSKHA